MDSIKNTVNACFYKNNFFVGPRIDIDNKDFEYAYSDGNNAYFGYRISYKIFSIVVFCGSVRNFL